MPNNQLEIRNITAVTERLRIPAYQRGYRWERRQVEQLLDDLNQHQRTQPDKSPNPYYLQPIVVAPLPDNPDYDLDLIDGQQRLTTVYLIIKALQAVQQFNGEAPNEELKRKLYALSGNLEGKQIDVKYTLGYETRKQSAAFLQNINATAPTDPEISKTPDELYIWHAYKVIEQWIYAHVTRVAHVADVLFNDVKVIWYELPTAVTGWKKFADLNVGKIPLTNSELVKALLMRSDNNEITDEQKKTIVQQWDAIEKELDDINFWGFLTSAKKSTYPTRIDLIFDIIARKPKHSTDDYFTFDYFESRFAAPDAPKGKDKWNNIYLEYQRLHDWYTDRELYHKIGFLSTLEGGDQIFQELFEYLSKPLDSTKALPTNSQFRAKIDELIRNAVALPEGIRTITELAYNVNDKYIVRLLTLYNVLYTLHRTPDRYDFSTHKLQHWSLEHIHAQHSVELSKQEQQKQWLEAHAESIDRFATSAEGRKLSADVTKQLMTLKTEMKAATGKKLDSTTFNDLVDRFQTLIVSTDDPTATSRDYEHIMSNMALLDVRENAVFNNSTFDVKRRKMIRLISGVHIPVCTQRVFLKSIEGADDNHPYFWGDIDRNAYIADIRQVLGTYIVESIPTTESDQEK